MKKLVKIVGVFILGVISKIINSFGHFQYGELNNKYYSRGVKYEFNFYSQWEKDHYQNFNINSLNKWSEII